MNREEHRQLIKEFRETIKDEYPDMNLLHLRTLVTCPWHCLALEMKEGDYRDFRFKYFGKFTVFKNSLKYILKSMRRSFENGTLNMSNAEYFSRQKKMLKKIDEMEAADPK